MLLHAMLSCRCRTVAAFLTGLTCLFSSALAVDEAYGPILLRNILTGETHPFSPDAGAPPPASASFSQSVFVTSPPDDLRHLFVVEKGGRIRIFDSEQELLLPEPFLTISPITSGGERGLLGLAFPPNFSETRSFFVNFTDSAGDTVVRRYRVENAAPPYVVEAGSALDLLTVAQPYSNHNGGWIAFGPDNFLYIALGDGGSGNDPQNYAQNRNTLLGKMLRIDVNGDDFPDDPTRNYAIPPDNPFVGKTGRDEIWAYGLRNPWRNSFDRQTGDLWIADVGQSTREEINFQPASSTGGENYGWRLREGMNPTPGGVGGARPAGNVDPVYDYGLPGGQSITGGYVYRGSAMPQLQGQYFFAEFVADFVKSFPHQGAPVDESDVITWSTSFPSPASFGEDASGELYLVSLNGGVYQITQSPWYLWRNQHFSEQEIHDVNISGPEAHPQGDGVPNLVKYALGLDPKKPVANLPVELSIENDGRRKYLTLSVDRSPSATDVELLVEAASRLSDGSLWGGDAVVVLEDERNRLVVRDSVAATQADRRFLRLRVTLEASSETDL